MWEETASSVSGFPSRSAQSIPFRHKTDSASTATARSDGDREEGYATPAATSPTAPSLLSTRGLSNPTLAEISPRRVPRREAVEGLKESADTMPAGTARDRSTTTVTYNQPAAAHSPASKRPSVDSQSPLRRRPLSSKRNSAAETPSVPESTTPRSPTLYDRLRRSIPNFSLSNPATLSHSRLPRSPRKNRSSGADLVASPLSPNAPERCEPEGTSVVDAVQNDVKSPPPQTVTSVHENTVTDQKGHAGNAVDNAVGDYPRTPQKDDNPPNEDVFMSIARSESGRRGSSVRSDARQVSTPVLR